MDAKTNVFNKAIVNLQNSAVMGRMKNRIIADYDENSPVDSAQLPHLNSRIAVVLTDAVYETLQMIADITNDIGNEAPFLLFGKYDYDNEMFVFDDIEGDASVGGNPHEANASGYLEQKLADFVHNSHREQDKVVAFGHTHPRVGAYYINFSIGDMRGYINSLKNPALKSISMICGCLLTGGNFNFVLCNVDDIYRIDNVFVYEKKNDAFKRLPCFGPDVANIPRRQPRER